MTECTTFRFLVSLDEFPDDVMYTLKNKKGKTIWDERPWDARDSGKVYVNEVCLDPFDCYTFSIADATGDGLTKAMREGKAGSFVVEYGSDVIASYDGESDGCYKRRSNTFGHCTNSNSSVPADGACAPMDNDSITTIGSTPTEVLLTCTDEELEFYFSITTDEKPNDSFFTIMSMTSGKLSWEEGPWQFGDERHFSDLPELQPQNMTKQFCFDPADCYTFWIDDRSDDGLTSGGEGHFEIQLDGEIVATYIAEVDGCFKSKSYIFGSCGFSDETMPGAC